MACWWALVKKKIKNYNLIAFFNFCCVGVVVYTTWFRFLYFSLFVCVCCVVSKKKKQMNPTTKCR